MKKIALIISMVALFAGAGNAQQRTFNYGLKLGPNVGWAAPGSTASDGGHARLGFALGGIVDINYTNHFGLSTGLNLNFMKMDYQFTDFRMATDFIEEVKVPVDRRFKGTYLELPIKIKAKADVADSWKAFVEAGLGFSYNLADKGKDTYNDPFGHPYKDEKYKDYSYQYRLIQTALNFGIGAQYEISHNLNVFAQLTFNHALSNTFTRDIKEQSGSIIRTNFIGLEIGIIN